MKEQLLTTLKNSKNYTLEVAANMPEEGYGFRPVDGVWNFGELLHHIAYGIAWWQENFILGKKMEWNPPAAPTGKKKIIAALEQAYASLEKTVKATAPGETAEQGFHATLDHITHHRGQAIVYLRCKGIAAPEYIY